MNTRHFNPRAIGPRIRQAREQQGLTLRMFAAKLGADDSNVAKWERGTSVPSLHNVALVAMALDVTTDWLLFGD